MSEKKYSFGKLFDLITATVLGVAAFAIFIATKANYAFPSPDGSSGAHLEVLWRGLDTASQRPYPLMETFASLFGAGNTSATVFGAIATVLMYFLTIIFIRLCMRGTERPKEQVTLFSRIGGIVAAVVFMSTPAVHEAATHLEPRLFALVWAMATALAALAGSGAGVGAVFSTDEEEGGETSGAAVARGCRATGLTAVLDGGAWSVTNAQKGIASFRLVLSVRPLAVFTLRNTTSSVTG